MSTVNSSKEQGVSTPVSLPPNCLLFLPQTPHERLRQTNMKAGLVCRLTVKHRAVSKRPSPAFCATDRNPTTSPSSNPAKHIWKANNSFRFLRLALLFRRFSITPPPTAVSGIPSTTTTRAMALLFRASVPAEPPGWWWWCKGTRN